VNLRWWLKQKLSAGRFYGDGGTIHNTAHLDVEIGPDGHVVSVWFRCQILPFVEHRVDADRATSMASASRFAPDIHGVEVDYRIGKLDS
jgi:hypothetical protein